MAFGATGREGRGGGRGVQATAPSLLALGGEKLSHGDADLWPDERRDMVAAAEITPALVGAIHGSAEDLQATGFQIDQPELRDPMARVERGLPLPVVVQRFVGDLDDEHGRGGMAVVVVLKRPGNHRKIRLRCRILSESERRLDADVVVRESLLENPQSKMQGSAV